jgi:hypothetical protein
MLFMQKALDPMGSSSLVAFHSDLFLVGTQWAATSNSSSFFSAAPAFLSSRAYGHFVKPNIHMYGEFRANAVSQSPRQPPRGWWGTIRQPCRQHDFFSPHALCNVLKLQNWSGVIGSILQFQSMASKEQLVIDDLQFIITESGIVLIDIWTASVEGVQCTLGYNSHMSTACYRSNLLQSFLLEGALVFALFQPEISLIPGMAAIQDKFLSVQPDTGMTIDLMQPPETPPGAMQLLNKGGIWRDIVSRLALVAANSQFPRQMQISNITLASDTSFIHCAQDPSYRGLGYGSLDMATWVDKWENCGTHQPKPCLSGKAALEWRSMPRQNGKTC